MKSVCLNPSVVIYLRSRDISVTIRSSLSEKGVCCGFTPAFDLKATKLTWMLKYLTCSPSIRNSCFSQNHGQAGFLEELIQKTNVLAKDGTHHKKAKLGVHLADRARPKRPFSASSPISVEKGRSEKNRVRSS